MKTMEESIPLTLPSPMRGEDSMVDIFE